jgi:Peptidase S24-like
MWTRGHARRKSNIKNLHSGTSGFSRRWHCPVAKFRSLLYSANSTSILLSCEPSMLYTLPLEDRKNPKLALAAEMLRCHGTVQLKAWGTSMLPSLWPGDLLTIQSAAHDEVVPGDIVLVMRDHSFFVHRLIEKRRVQDCLSWIMRGDAIPHNDPPVGASELLGRVACVHRGNRSFVPSRRVSRLHSMLAWMLCRWDCFRSLTLRIHAACLQAGLTSTNQYFFSILRLVRGIPSTSPSHNSQP